MENFILALKTAQGWYHAALLAWGHSKTIKSLFVSFDTGFFFQLYIDCLNCNLKCVIYKRNQNAKVVYSPNVTHAENVLTVID